MKKLMLLSVLSFFISLMAFSQNMIFTFIPKDASNVIDSISAINLVTGETVLVKGTNEISFTSTSVNINLIPENISIYPNPSFGQAEMQFYSKQRDEIKIVLINTAGQIVASEKQHLKQGFHKFRITTRLNGMYMLQVVGNDIKFSQKIITTGNYHYINNIEYIGLTSNNSREKSAVVEEPNVIHFFIYSGDKITKIADSPAESKTYEVEFFECKDADGKTYKIVTIYGKEWMAENLAYLPSVSSPSDESYTEPNYYVFDYNGTDVTAAKATDNYKTYGALYNWPAALSACPNGWHLPTDDEWKQLEMSIGMSQSEADSAGWRGTNEGTKLRTTSGWKCNGNGTDDFGFSALPGGYRSLNGDFYFWYVGGSGYWWSATEYDSNNAWTRDLFCSSTVSRRLNLTKKSGFSVRCVSDESQTQYISISTKEISDTTSNSAWGGGIINGDGGYKITSRGVCWNTTGNPTVIDNKTEDGLGVGEFTSCITGLTVNTTYYVKAYAINSNETAYGEEKVFTTREAETSGETSTLTDSRDGKTYKTVTIYGKEWMAENLAYLPSVSSSSDESYTEPNYYVYDYIGTDVTAAKATDNYKTYGVLYNWPAALSACPNGWHLPTDDEWEQLARYVSSQKGPYSKLNYDWYDVGAHLKSTSGWNNNGNGTDDFGFSGLPGGYRYGVNFSYFGDYGYWWSATEGDSGYAWGRNLYYDSTTFYRYATNKRHGFSVRCVRD